MNTRKMSTLLEAIAEKRQQFRNEKWHSRLLKCLNAIHSLLK